MRWPFRSTKTRLREEAAAWLVRMNGRHDESERQAFEHWYRADPDHAATYERLKAQWHAHGVLARSSLADAPVLQSWAGRGRGPVRYALAGALAAAVLVAALVLGLTGAGRLGGGGTQMAAFTTEAAEARKVRLTDGSLVELSPSSLLRVMVTPRERRFLLERGTARFAVAHEPRPFIVAAAQAEVIAHGTIFVVRVEGERARVALIDGSVDVTYPSRDAGRRGRTTTRLHPGERLAVGGPQASRVHAPAIIGMAATPAMLQFDDTPLSSAVEEANGYGGTPIRVEGAAGHLRVTGAFRRDDPRALARTLAATFGLELVEQADGTLLLRAPRPARP